MHNGVIARAGIAALVLAGLPTTMALTARPAGAALPSNCVGAATITCQFSYNGTTGSDGSVQTFTVPAGVKSVRIDAYGAGTGLGAGGHDGGTVAVTAGQVLEIRVGGGPNSSGAGGYNGGGAGGSLGPNGGGGASDVRPPGGGLADRIVTAGGAGGGGGVLLGPSTAGGGGGGGNGLDAVCGAAGCAHGATDTGAGAGGSGTCTGSGGGFGVGGASCGNGGGGGGGWYGGGGGTSMSGGLLTVGGGGGGSGHVVATATNPVHEQAKNSGSAAVVISFTPKPPFPPAGNVSCNLSGSATYKGPLTNTPSTKDVKVTVTAAGSCGSGAVGGKAPITDIALRATLYLGPGTSCDAAPPDPKKAGKLQIKWQGRKATNNKLFNVAVTNTTATAQNLTGSPWLVFGAPVTDPNKPFANQQFGTVLFLTVDPSILHLDCVTAGLPAVQFTGNLSTA